MLTERIIGYKSKLELWWKKWYGLARIKMLGGFYNGSKVVNCLSGIEGSNLIKKKILEGDSFMVGRYGRYEFRTVARERYGHQWSKKSALKRMSLNAGFFPKKESLLAKFANMYIEETKKIDCFCAWHFRDGFWKWEEKIFRENCPDAILMDARAVKFLRHKNPWTTALKDKKVLVVHPFADTIERQYRSREYLFANRDVIPELKRLETISAVQSAGGNEVPFRTWFEALESMKEKMEEVEFDVALIGAGAYGLPLAAHAKRLGKQGIHVGGVLQLLFGIMGTRWEDRHGELVNKHWTRPQTQEKPPEAEKIEGEAYW